MDWQNAIKDPSNLEDITAGELPKLSGIRIPEEGEAKVSLIIV